MFLFFTSDSLKVLKSLDPKIFFSEMKKINSYLRLKEMSMGMSEDYIEAIEHTSTFLRIGSKIFGQRS